MKIENIIKFTEQCFSKRHFNVIKYDYDNIICQRNDFDLRILDYIEEISNNNIEYEFGIDEIKIKIKRC